MWGQIAQAIAKVYGENEETKRNAINKVSDAAKAGDGNNGADYSNLDAGSEGGEGGGIASVGSGYQKPTAQNTSGTASVTNSAGNLVSTGKDIVSTFANKGKGAEGESKDEEEEDTKNAVDLLGSSSGGMNMGSLSDERLKRIFGDNEDAIKAFAKIDAIKFEYNDKAKELYPEGEKNVDSDPHYGVKAQDLKSNPYTASTVQTDPNTGYLNVNTQELTMANSAVISDICKRLLAIENILGVKVV